ncbi:hypothetical protein [Halapricum desulfuricans]|uniref:Uncharacterized protein n=1 Tax=Halapricum desulfuricans TaxID=2841257 RepID=A0A897N1U3_9EURY|nr:hypothetical protein [Halapricum desulfuricans]QSG06687.1 hypothetical protein HSR121_2366 [Halapricum desulfuricans]
MLIRPQRRAGDPERTVGDNEGSSDRLKYVARSKVVTFCPSTTGT